MMAPLLVGRDRELRALDDLLDGAPERGRALVVRGEAGIGKSALLAAATQRARQRAMAVLATSGVQTEAHLPFAGLHQLLRPIWAGIDELPAPQRTAVQAAFGMTDAAAPDPFLIALAALELLADAAAGAPLLVIADDAQWLDRSTADVLAFVARRLESEPIVLLIADRDGFESSFTAIGLPELRLEGLDAVAAGVLLDASEDVAPSVRQRLLDDAAGNPLALVELRAALGSEQRGGGAPLPAWLPLTTRLERAFTARLPELPAATRTLLLVAAVDDGGDLLEILGAAAALLGHSEAAAEALEPAVAAHFVEVDETHLRFRHPLVRSAIRQAASNPQRHAAHAALAGMLADQPDRRAWHRAAASVGPSEAAASELEAAAARSQGRGAIAVAVLAFERAATLSVDPGRRGARLLRAAELAFELGRRDDLTRLLHEVEALDLEPLDRLRLVWVRESFDAGIPADDAVLLSLVETAGRATAAGDPNLSLNILLATAVKCWWAAPGEAVREAVIAAAERAAGADDDPRLLNILALTDPVGRGAVVIDRLERFAAGAMPDARTTNLLCGAACAVAHYELADRFLAASADGLRAQGRLGPLAQALVMRALTATFLAQLSLARLDAEEGGRLARETAQPQWEAYARAAGAMLAGLRGDEDTADSLAAEAERLVLPMRSSAVLAVVQLARGWTALGGGRHAAAYGHLRRLFDPTDLAYHPLVRCVAVGDLAEAAVHSGHRDEATALLTSLEPIAARNPSPRVQIPLRYARALLADDNRAEGCFLGALDAGLTSWPFDRARLQLTYGAWLRRHRRVAESRPHLRAARDTFDALGALPWGERARQELRAAGETSRRRTPDTLDLLTPQELQIAQMAAAGLTNREIGQRLYLSHRTIGMHLYHVFPKLGITHRSELRTAQDAGNLVGAWSPT